MDVVVATSGLDEATMRQISAACDRLHARYVAWADSERPIADRADVVIAGLPAGQRRIPPHLLRQCTEAHPGTPLLLLCQEALVSPTVSLHGGQVVLIAPPFSASRIVGRLSVLHCEREPDDAPSSVVTAVDDPAARVWSRERLHDDVWLAALGCRDPHDRPVVTPLATNQLEGALAILPVRPGLELALPRRTELLDALHAPLAPPERRLQLERLAGELGLVYFDRRSEEWIVHWPNPGQALWLCSAQRLPAAWDLGTSVATHGARTLRAAPGDLLIGLAGTAEAPFSDLAELVAAAAGARGGQAALAALERRLDARPQGVSGVLIEVRG